LRALQALADPSRWRIVEELAAAPRTMGELAIRVESLRPPARRIIFRYLKKWNLSCPAARLARSAVPSRPATAGPLASSQSSSMGANFQRYRIERAVMPAPELEPIARYRKPIEEFLF
jgi:hypothetical protein